MTQTNVPLTDDLAVDHFANRMKVKLAQKRQEGRDGWQDPNIISNGNLSDMLMELVEKGDPVDVANVAMMIAMRGETIKPSQTVTHLEDRLNRAYTERAAVAVTLAKAINHMGYHNKVAGMGIDAEAKSLDWANVLYIDTLGGQISFHIAPHDMHLTKGLPDYPKVWDGTYRSRSGTYAKIDYSKDALSAYKEELLRIAEAVGEPEDPFSAWELIAPLFPDETDLPTGDEPEVVKATPNLYAVACLAEGNGSNGWRMGIYEAANEFEAIGRLTQEVSAKTSTIKFHTFGFLQINGQTAEKHWMGKSHHNS